MTTEWWTELKSVTLHVDGERAPLWPDGATEEYRAARRALVEAEAALREQVHAVAALRRALPPGPVLRSYDLTEGPIDLSSDGRRGPSRSPSCSETTTNSSSTT